MHLDDLNAVEHRSGNFREVHHQHRPIAKLGATIPPTPLALQAVSSLSTSAGESLWFRRLVKRRRQQPQARCALPPKDA